MLGSEAVKIPVSNVALLMSSAFDNSFDTL